METSDRLNQVMQGAIHMLDDLLKSRSRIPEQVVDLVHHTLNGAAQVIDYALDRGIATLPSREESN